MFVLWFLELTSILFKSKTPMTLSSSEENTHAHCLEKDIKYLYWLLLTIPYRGKRLGGSEYDAFNHVLEKSRNLMAIASQSCGGETPNKYYNVQDSNSHSCDP